MTLTLDPVERIDLDDDGVDDVAIAPGGDMFRLERMSKSSFWSCIYVAGGRHVFWFYAEKGKRMTVEYRWEPLED